MERVIASLVVLVLALPLAATADVIPQAVPDLPVLGNQAYRGNDLITTPTTASAPTAKSVDGDPSDWVGEASRFGGTSIYSRGEFVYQDYVNDDWGADNGNDAARAAITDPLASTESRTYRLEILAQAAGEQFGAEQPVGAPSHYGDAAQAGLADNADIAEVRVAADASTITLLVRTTGMTSPNATAVLVLFDTVPGGPAHTFPGGVTSAAERGLVAIGSAVTFFADGAPSACACVAAADATGFRNSVEISIPRTALGPHDPTLSLAVATGLSADGETIAATAAGDAVSDLINVAFRYDEPARIWMDHDQAFALRLGTIDDFYTSVDLGKLASGYSESFVPRPGYFERVYISDSPVVREAASNGMWQGTYQHYGIYLPTRHRAGHLSAATWWTHYRGGHAHDAAAWVPGLIRQLGEDRDRVMIFPSARGTSSWYVGRGHEDFLEVWDDAMSSFSIDPARVGMSGYSMGGYASWLLPLLYPDRFAVSFPTAGPPTQGLWDGIGLVSTGANDGRAREQLTFDIIGNAANVGYVIYHGSNDELVPVSGAIRMASELTRLGYTNRLYVFPGAEHFTNAIYDEWTDAARYIEGFQRDPNPPRVVYTIKPALEKAIEEVQASGATLDYSFDGAYWVDDLRARTGGNGLDPAATGQIDATTFGRGMIEYAGVPEVGSGGQFAPHVMTGLRKERLGTIAPANRLTASLRNLSSATLDVGRMGLSTAETVTASITTDGPTTILLAGTWPAGTTVTGASSYSLGPDGLSIAFDSNGDYLITIRAA